MNEKTLEILEFHKIINTLSGFALTEEGKRELAKLAPSTNKVQIEMQLDEVTEAVRILEKSSSVPIHSLDGLETVLSGMNKGVPLRVDQLMKLFYFLEECRKLKTFMKDKIYAAPRVATYVASIQELPQLAEAISTCIRQGRVDDYASKELQRIRKQLSIQEERLKNKVQSLLKSPKYKSCLQESIVSTRQGRYVIPVKKEHRGKVRGEVLDMSGSGATLYIEPEELRAQQEQLMFIKMEEEKEVERILWELTGLSEEHEPQLKLAVETMIYYDVLFAKAKYSRSIGAIAPAINESQRILLKNAVHPLLGAGAVPLNFSIGHDYHALLITGPNTGGKTVTLKTVGLLTLMAQCGLHIPSGPGSEISIFQQILLDIGDGQNLQQNLSTFSSHITNIIGILKETNDRTLVLLDELGSGTDPGEGMGLATVILEQLYEKGATLLATTHFSEIKAFAEEREGFVNGSMEFDLESLKPTYRLIVGKGGESQAFSIAWKLGMHPELIQKAHRITYGAEQEYSVPFTDPASISDMEKQIIVNKYKKRNHAKKEASREKLFEKGDNVRVSSTGEFGVVYEGPDENGHYMVQVKGTKQSISHKRLDLHIRASELYPEGYDFDIIFNSKENRKKSKLMSRKYVEGLTIEHEE
ncbi:endonuclease MutS2 [Bacillus massilinigeriensis]|uniref:endonuclease MutS2 n=1 Tax=Bacillus mediterraneensis TaxID=1805474 RepID=UPI0008F91739|nr:DNA mismatch repair protein [Bacillus mediterraneensis]